jgi:hypothetical protein
MLRLRVVLTSLNRLLLAAVLIFSSSISTRALSLPHADDARSPADQALLPQDGLFDGVFLKTESARPGPDVPKPLLATVALGEADALLRSYVLAAQAPGINHVSPLIITQNSASDL